MFHQPDEKAEGPNVQSLRLHRSRLQRLHRSHRHSVPLDRAEFLQRVLRAPGRKLSQAAPGRGAREVNLCQSTVSYTKMKNLFIRLFPGAAALAALLLVGSFMLRADPSTPPAAASPQAVEFQRPAATQSVPPYQAAPQYAAAQPGQLVCGACGELLQAPQPVLIAQPLQGRPVQRYQAQPRPMPATQYYADQPMYYSQPAPQQVIYVMPEAIDEVGFRPGAPIQSIFPLSTQWRLPAQYIPPYSDRDVRVMHSVHQHRNGW